MFTPSIPLYKASNFTKLKSNRIPVSYTHLECVPNFSEGRDLQKIDKIVAPFRGKQGVKLLDYSNDEDHNLSLIHI